MTKNPAVTHGSFVFFWNPNSPAVTFALRQPYVVRLPEQKKKVHGGSAGFRKARTHRCGGNSKTDLVSVIDLNSVAYLEHKGGQVKAGSDSLSISDVAPSYGP